MNKKLRKLLHSPHTFFLDAGTNLIRKVSVSLNGKGIGKSRAAATGKISCKYRYSVLTVVSSEQAVQQAEALAAALSGQTVNAAHAVEFICVDARPADSAPWKPNTGALVSVKVIRTASSNESAARNAALARASGDWVTFIEADEIISADYLQRIDQFLKSKPAANVGLACAKLAYHDPINNKITDNVVRNNSLKDKPKALPLVKLPTFYLTSLAGVFFKTSVLTAHASRFSGTGIRSVEDLVFAAKFMYHMSSFQVGLISNTRVLISSKLQRRESEEMFVQKLPGVTSSTRQLLELLNLGCTEENTTPKKYTLHAVLHFMCTAVDQAVSSSMSVSAMPPAVVAALDAMYAEVFELIPAATIEGWKQTPFRNRVGLLKRYKTADPKTQVLYVEGYDEQNAWARLRYFASEQEPLELLKWGSADITPAIAKSRLMEFLGKPFLYERYLWLPCDQGRGRLGAKLSKASASIYMSGKPREELLPYMVAEEFGRPRPLADAAFPLQVRLIRRMAQRAETAARYRDAWLFIDRDVEADDNAEHLYRYVQKHHPEINAYFILDPKSPSWNRLNQEGFRLLPFGSMAHKLALLHCRHLLSSHAAPFVVNLMPKKWYGDLLKYRFTFLQHGVTKDDISKWINSRSIDCFVTTSDAEYTSIANNGNRYKLTARDVIKSGFPRHDALLAGAGKTEKLVMIMPTWRLFLAGALVARSSTRSLNEAFYTSQFALAWKGILHSERFARVLKEHGYKAVLFPHPNIEPYLDWFQVPAHIEVIRSEQRGSIQSLFRRSAMMLTDYSSVAFEMAYLHKPVLYYQFDRDLVFGGQHSYQKGYYDYDLHGFGPVALEENKYLDDIERFIARDCEPGTEYRRRIEAAFAHIDTDNCKRTFEAVRSMDELRNQRGLMPELPLRYAELASQHEDWALAASRWAQQASTCEADALPRALMMLVHALRRVGRLDEAWDLLGGAETLGEFEYEFDLERAEITATVREWVDALGYWRKLAAHPCATETEQTYFQLRIEQAEPRALLMQLRTLRYEERFQEAAEIFLSAKPPEDLALQYSIERAELATASQQWIVALEMWEQLAAAKLGTQTELTRYSNRIKSTRPHALLMKVRELRQAGQLDEATAELAKASSLKTLQRDFAIERSELAMAKGEWTEALERWQKLSTSTNVTPEDLELFNSRIEECAALACASVASSLVDDAADASDAVTDITEASLEAATAKSGTAVDAAPNAVTVSSASERSLLTNQLQALSGLAAMKGIEPVQSATPVPEMAPQGTLTDQQTIEVDHMLREKLNHWAAVLALPGLDNEVRLMSRKEIARLRIKAGDFEAAEADINALRGYEGHALSVLLLSLELALARGHGGEASSTMNLMVGMPLSALSQLERRRFGHCLQALTVD